MSYSVILQRVYMLETSKGEQKLLLQAIELSRCNRCAAGTAPAQSLRLVMGGHTSSLA